MRCHQHLDSEAVAVCVGCGRGLCRPCQQLTIDQRNLCGMPQCQERAQQQKAVSFVLQQSCTNLSSACQSLALLLRALSLAVMIPCIAVALILGGWMALHPYTTTIDMFALVVLLLAAVWLAVLVLRFQTRLRWLQGNWEDLGGEFRVRAEQPEAPETTEAPGA